VSVFAWATEGLVGGGEAGRAVWAALRKTVLLSAVITNGDEIRRRKTASGEGDGGDSGRGTRVASRLGTKPWLTARGIVPLPNTILDLGGEGPVGEAARTAPVD
jgi:hypothetical protein